MNKQQLIDAIRAKQDKPLAESTLKRKPVAELEKLLASLATEEPTDTEPPTAEEPVSEEPTEEVEEDLIGDVAPAKEKTKFDLAATKSKIAKLLAKAECTDNEHERDTFNAAAEKMMLRLGIERAELEAAGEVKAEEIIEVRRHFESVYAKNMVNFGHAVCGGIGNLTTLQSGRWSNATLYIIGHKSDVELAVRLLDSLELQVMSALVRWQKTTDRKGMPNYDKLVGNRSFIAGFAQTVHQRVAEAHRVVEQEEQVSTGAALVLASKQERINDWVSDTYGKLGKGQRSGYGAFSSHAAAAGRAAGNSADVGAKRVGGKKGELA